MKYCLKCKSEYEDEFTFCPKCGTQLKDKSNICLSCGRPIEIKADFCPFCGKSLKTIIKKPNIKQQSYGNNVSGSKNIQNINGVAVSIFNGNSSIKSAIITFLYLLGFLVWFLVYHFSRLYRLEFLRNSVALDMHNDALPLEIMLSIAIIGSILLYVLYFLIAKIDDNRAKYFNRIIVFGTVATVFGLFGGILGAVFSVLFLWTLQTLYIDNKFNDTDNFYYEKICVSILFFIILVFSVLGESNLSR